MIPKPIDHITKEDIEDLVAQQREEGKSLEYKEQLPDISNNKKNFLRLVASFANSAGGDIVYGIVEAQENGRNSGKPEKAIGVEVDNVDQTKLQLHQVIRTGIEPRIIPEVSFQAIESFERGPVIVARIARSLARPHMVWLGKKSHFYARSTNGMYPMDVSEIKASFLGVEEVAERMNNFRKERIATIEAGDTPSNIPQTAKTVIHLLPLVSFDYFQEPSIEMGEEIYTDLAPIYTRSSWNSRHNFFGYINYNSFGYVQFFRSGAIEAVDTHNSSVPSPREDGQDKIIFIKKLQQNMIAAVKRYAKLLVRVDIPLPVFICCSLVNVRDYVLYLGGGFPKVSRNPIAQNELLFPEIQMGSYDFDPKKLMMPFMDMLWQSFGYNKAYLLDD